MATVASPYGLVPVSMTGSRYNNHGVNRFSLISNSSAAFYYGCPVTIAAGVVTPLSATITAGTASGATIGVFVGAEYDDPVMNYRLENNYLPANAISNGYGNVKLFIVDDPDAVFMLQADGSVANTARGRNIALQTFTGNTTTHKSNITGISGGIAVTATLAMKIVGANNDTWSDTYTDLLVKWNFGSHLYTLPLSL